jgi:hypothetical protein
MAYFDLLFSALSMAMRANIDFIGGKRDVIEPIIKAGA